MAKVIPRMGYNFRYPRDGVPLARWGRPRGVPGRRSRVAPKPGATRPQVTGSPRLNRESCHCKAMAAASFRLQLKIKKL